MKTIISSDPAIFTQRKQALSELAKLTPGQPFFSLPYIQLAWASQLATGQLVSIACQGKDNELVGFAAFEEVSTTQHKTWQLIGGTEESDYLDVLLNPSHAEEVIVSLLAEFTKAGVTKVQLNNLSAHSLFLNKLSTLTHQSDWKIETQQHTVCPVITLPHSWETYLQGLASSAAQQIKRAVRDVGAEDEIEHELIEERSQLDQAITDFIELHKQSGPTKANFWTAEREAFLKQLGHSTFAEQQLKLYFMKVNGERAAALWIFDYENQFLLYNSGFNAFRYGHLRVGTVQIAHTIQEAIRLGKTRYDFMRGDEPYKFTFGADPEPLYNLVLTNKN